MTETQHPTAERLQAFVEGTLHAGDRSIVESHLFGCPHCHGAADEWRALFAALSALPPLEPSLGFADRVMAGVRLSPRAGWQSAWHRTWQQQAARAGALAARVAPKSTFGWGLAAAMLALPLVVGASAMAWLLSRSYMTPQSLWLWTRDTAAEGLQNALTTFVATLMQTDVAAWIVARSGELVSTAGITGVGALAAAAGLMTLLSVWILYRNLIRTPRRGSHYVTYSF